MSATDANTERLRELLGRLDMSREAVARHLEISARELRRMLAGTAPTPRIVILALEKLLSERGA